MDCPRRDEYEATGTDGDGLVIDKKGEVTFDDEEGLIVARVAMRGWSVEFGWRAYDRQGQSASR